MNGKSPAGPDYSVLSAFQGPIKRPRVSLLYQLSVLPVTIVMVLLPLAYLALIGALGFGIWYLATHYWDYVIHPVSGSGRLAHLLGLLLLMGYFLALFIGVVVLFFLVKPLLARRKTEAQPLALNPSNEPLLYAFVQKVCETVGAPSPRRIDLNCDLNASAGFRRGFLSFFKNDFVLTIGLPLVANFNTREFAGVVAHEFGHFTQGVGMRLMYVTRRVLNWLDRVAYQRDAWDMWLEYWATDSENPGVTFLCKVVQPGIWLSRTILKGLQYIGVFFCGFLLRQMEYNADAYETRVAGSEGFESAQRKLATLTAAMDLTYKQIQARWNVNQQLPANISELLRRNHEKLPADLLQNINDTLVYTKTGFFDTHPSPADRIRKSQRAAAPGVFHDERPATSLFASFEHPARFVTMLHYEYDHNLPVEPEMLLSATPVKSKPTASETGENRLARDEYFLGVLPLLLPLRISSPATSGNPAVHLSELVQLSEYLRRVADKLETIGKEFAVAMRKSRNARAALPLMKALVPIHAPAFDLTESRPEAAHEAQAEAVAALESLRHSVHEVAGALEQRLNLALSLRLAERVFTEGKPISERIRDLVEAINQAAVEYPHQFALLDALAVRDRMMVVKKEEGETPILNKAIAAQNAVISGLIPNLPAPLTNGEVEALQARTQQWFAEYEGRVEELAEIARMAETAVA